ncbi:toprim domain-containing protein [Methylomagnum ishizawai]|uniref:toprim domain-containing protein n=1 Tax=Methylomagnum ishizawai TaxID=1760988 RepID=UPI001C324DB9|nr:toprim domain-containing protein [Methylomagnum ishizawai]BBL73186.1 hypothetical protein MishRS11D_02840 [Methylomagnum ishizawai]
MKPSEISALLAEQAESVAKHLLPEGKRDGREWRCGSVHGEPGQSLGVHLSGPKAGVWADFASGQGGDLLDLWMTVGKTDLPKAMREAARWLGVAIDPPRFAKGGHRRAFVKPSKTPVEAQKGSAPWAWLTETRKLPEPTLRAFRVGGHGRSALFPFYDPAGELAMVKWRDTAWTKETGRAKSGVTEKDMRPALFGWQAIPPGARWVVIAEGEIDAMSLHAYGAPALSVPFGGGTGAKQDWIEHEFDHLERFDEVFLCLDSDGEGRKATLEIADRLGRHRCRVVELPGGHKDANECLKAGVAGREMLDAFAAAKTLDPGELRRAGEFLDGVLAAFYPAGAAEIGFSLPWPKCPTLLFRPGEVSLIAGVNGHGKSEGVGHLAVDIMRQGARVCVASMEFKPARWIARIVRQISGLDTPSADYVRAIMTWLDARLWAFDVVGAAKHKEMLRVFAYARQRYGVRLFVIDNMSKLDIGLEDYDGQRAFVESLCGFAKAHDAHVFLVAHVRKGEDDGKPGGKFDVKGSGAITDLVDTVLIWWRNRKKEERLKRSDLSDAERQELEEKPDALCVCEKQRNGEDEPRIALWFHRPSHQFLPFRNSKPVEYVPFSTREPAAEAEGGW